MPNFAPDARGDAPPDHVAPAGTAPPVGTPPPVGTVDTPFARAARLIEYATTLTADEWDDVARRASDVEPAAYKAAVRRLGAVLVGHPQSRALAALNRAACDAPARTARPLPHVTAEQACSYAGRVTAHAAFAIALARELGPDAVAVLTAPMNAIVHRVDAEPGA